MKIKLLLVILGIGVTSTAYAQDTVPLSNYCQMIGKIAVVIMAARQNGAPKEKLIAASNDVREKVNAEVKKQGKEIAYAAGAEKALLTEKELINIAYTKPVYKTEDDKKNAIIVFSVQRTLACEDNQ